MDNILLEDITNLCEGGFESHVEWLIYFLHVDLLVQLGGIYFFALDYMTP